MKVIWTPSADCDRHRIWMFTAERSVVRADRVEARLTDRVQSLGGLPGQGRPLAGGLRQLAIPDIQLVVRYRVVEDEDVVRILRIFHTRENREEP